MFVSSFLTLLSVHSTLAAVISPILFESSGNGFVYLPATPIPNPAHLSSGTDSGISTKISSGLNLTSTLGTAYVSGLSTTSASTAKISDPSISSTPSTTSISVPSVALVASKNSGFSVTSTSNILNRIISTNWGTWKTSGLSLTSALSSPSITKTPDANSGYWPASITYVAESSSVTVVVVAFVTTVNGTSEITTTQPQQSLITPTGSGYSLIAITEKWSTTTLTLDSLPTATVPSEPTGVQVVTQSGIPVAYSPITLPGYSNTEPVEICTAFTETFNGQINTQGGWYVIWLNASSLGSNLAPRRGSMMFFKR